MSAKLRLPPGLGAATYVVAVLAFGVLIVGASLTAFEPAPGHAAAPAAVRAAG